MSPDWPAKDFYKLNDTSHTKATKEIPVLIDPPPMAFTCTLCSRQFRRQVDLTRHIKVHIDWPFECNDCGKKFLCPRDVRRHQEKKRH